MSTILDALRKSEQERKLNNVPTLSDMPTPQEASRWPIIAFIVVSILLALGLGFFISQYWSASTDTVVVTSSGNPPPTDATEAVTQPVAAEDIVINVVSYSDDVEQRFVMINGKLVRQGEFVRAGLKVDEIKPGSVVLNERGRKIIRKP